MPEPEEKNPAYDLMKIPFSEIAGSVLINQAVSITIMQLQVKILAKLELRDAEEVRKEVSEMLDKNYMNLIDKAKKTI